MSKKILSAFLFFVIILFFSASHSYSQEEAFDIEELKKSAPKVFIDCDHCDIDYMRNEITFVNYVWDRQEAREAEGVNTPSRLSVRKTAKIYRIP